jgi:hypothetical protein
LDSGPVRSIMASGRQAVSLVYREVDRTWMMAALRELVAQPSYSSPEVQDPQVWPQARQDVLG